MYSCSHVASLLYTFLFSYSGFQNFSMSFLFGEPMMMIRLPRSLSKSFDCLFIKMLFYQYCFCLLWCLDSLLLRAHRRCLNVSIEVDLVCLSTIRYFDFNKFVFLLIKVLFHFDMPNDINREEKSNAKSIKLQTDYLFVHNVQDLVKYRHFPNVPSHWC